MESWWFWEARQHHDQIYLRAATFFRLETVTWWWLLLFWWFCWLPIVMLAMLVLLVPWSEDSFGVESLPRLFTLLLFAIFYCYLEDVDGDLILWCLALVVAVVLLRPVLLVESSPNGVDCICCYSAAVPVIIPSYCNNCSPRLFFLPVTLPELWWLLLSPALGVVDIDVAIFVGWCSIGRTRYYYYYYHY